jgi:cellulose synthase/poly-beta-1,6-N-acetylglucosamine synthase-like glycosyltransferase
LLWLAGITAILYGALDVQGASLVIVVGLLLAFLVFLVRHLAFAASALAAAPGDMRSRTGFDFGYRPFVTVLVPCRNEELVIRGLLDTLLAFDYPVDRHEIIVIDDGSDDDTGAIVDQVGREHPLPPAARRWRRQERCVERGARDRTR